MTPGIAVVALAASLYLILTGHPALPASGLPFGAAGTVCAAAVVFVAVFFRHSRLPRSQAARLTVAFVALGLVKAMLGTFVEPEGWTARYYANDRWEGQPEWSSDFPRLTATRIDPAISFRDDTFPVYYLNESRFERPEFRREIVEPLSVEWEGLVTLDQARADRFSITARGAATVLLDARPVLTVSSQGPAPSHAARDVEVAAGTHRLSVRYAKPAGVEGLIELALAHGHQGAWQIRPTSSRVDGAPSSRAWLVAAVLLHVAFLLALARLAWLCERGTPADLQLRQGLRSVNEATVRLVGVAVTALFALQGVLQARHMIGRAVVLTGGDDWFGFEAGARDVMRGDLLMTFGKPLGEGRAYFSHPLYSYLLAAAHRLTGEGLFGPIFLQFLLLAIVTMLVYRMTASLLGRVPALAGLTALIALFELDFTRYYTVTLLSENAYILTVTLTLGALMRWVQSGRQADLLFAAFFAGVSSITRPAMMMYLFPLLACVAAVSMIRAGSFVRAASAVSLAAVVWFAVIAPVTLRNYVVSGHLVLISDGLGETFIKFNLPPAIDGGTYSQMFTGGVVSGLRVLARIAWDHPREMLAIQLQKVSFSLGMVHWHSGYRPHPELIAATAGYVLVAIACRPLRAIAMWPVHLFVLAHVASMSLTLPWNYGYRLILPPFIYSSAFAAAGVCWLVMAHRGILLEGQAA